MKKPKPPSEIRFRQSSGSLPASQRMLQLIRNELKADIRGLKSEMKAGFHQMDSRFEGLSSDVARLGALVEEQNSRNQIVLEGLTGLFQRQERLEARFDENDVLVRSISRSRA